MGIWDTSLYGGDLPLGIKDEYYEQLYEGHTPEKAAALVRKELRLGEEDLPVLRLILADVQWKLGQMTEDMLHNALEVSDNGAAVTGREGASESDRRSRQHVPDRLRKKLESPQGPPKAIEHPKLKKSKFRIGDIISTCLIPYFADRNPEFEMYRDRYFMVQVVGYTDHLVGCNCYLSIEQCGDFVVLDQMGDAIPDTEAFEDVPMLDLKEALYWLTRSFIVAGMHGVKDVQCIVIGHAQVKFSQVVPECAWLNDIDNWRTILPAIAMAYMTQHSADND